MSFKRSNVIQVPLTTGGTVNLPNGVFAFPATSIPTENDYATEYLIGGTQALTSNFIIAMTSPADNTVVDIYWRARATPGAFTVTILGQVIPADLLGKDFTMKFIANGGSFSLLETNLDLTKGSQLPADRLVNASVNTAQMTDKAITYAKIQDVAAHSVPVRASGTSGVLANLAMAANSIMARIAGDIVNLAATTNGHVLKMTAGALGFAQVNFSELAGTIANAQIPDREVALSKMDSTGQIAAQTADVLTTAVTTEETLFSYTLPADFVAAQNEGFIVDFCGMTAANANTKTIRVKFAGTTYLVNAVTTAPNGVLFGGTVKIYRGATVNDAVGNGDMWVATAFQGVQGSKNPVDWSVSNILEVTGQNGTVSAGDITLCHVSVRSVR